MTIHKKFTVLPSKEQVKKSVSFSFINNFEDIKEDYHEQDGGLVGHRGDKAFYRVDSESLKSLIEELQNNPDCGYVTNANDVIKDGVVPQKLSAMIKQLRWDSDSYNESLSEELIINEVLSSQILNYFGCPTSYNTAVKVKNEENMDEFQLLSVDFVPFGTKFETFDEYSCRIIDSVEYTVENLRKQMFSMMGKVPDENSEKFVEDFVYSYLVRKYVINDHDFFHINAGVLSDESLQMQYLNFDFEFCFYSEFPNLRRGNIKQVKEDLIYVEKNFPRVYDIFVKKLNIFSHELKRLINNNEIEYLNKYHKFVVEEEIMDNVSNLEFLMRTLTPIKE